MPVMRATAGGEGESNSLGSAVDKTDSVCYGVGVPPGIWSTTTNVKDRRSVVSAYGRSFI